MIKVNGKNNFKGRFDCIEWSAPYYETPHEIIRALKDLDLKRKSIKNIRVIGAVYDTLHDAYSRLYERIKNSGIDVSGNWSETYPYLDNMRIDWKVTACEPIQFIFDDGTTLEILPTGYGSARIAVNSIPADIVNGLNDSVFDAGIFFAEAIGRQWDNVYGYIEENTKQYINGEDSEWDPYKETTANYRIVIDLDCPFELELSQSGGGWYSICMRSAGIDGDKIPYRRHRSALKSTDKITIINGNDHGGVFWIVPYWSYKTEENGLPFFIDQGISIDNCEFLDFMEYFLRKYFDPSIQTCESEKCDDNGCRLFDEYGSNLYTFAAMRKMLDEIRLLSKMLVEDHDNPELDDVKAQLGWYPREREAKLLNKDLDELRKSRTSVAVDFYERFVARIESMMTIQGRDVISFAGP